MVEENIPCALILEDDAELSVDTEAVVNALAARYQYSTEEAIVLLTHVPAYFEKGQISLTPHRSLVMPHGLCWYAHGYFLNLQTARRLLKKLYPVWVVSDHWKKFQEYGLVKVRAVAPYCIGLNEHHQVSSIQVPRKKRPPLFVYLKHLYQHHCHLGWPLYVFRKTTWALSQKWQALTRGLVQQPQDMPPVLSQAMIEEALEAVRAGDEVGLLEAAHSRSGQGDEKG